jgi:hypothetical protein
MAVITQLYFQIVEEIDYVFWPFSGWAIIGLKLEYSNFNLMMAHPDKGRNM